MLHETLVNYKRRVQKTNGPKHIEPERLHVLRRFDNVIVVVVTSHEDVKLRSAGTLRLTLLAALTKQRQQGHNEMQQRSCLEYCFGGRFEATTTKAQELQPS